MLRCSHCGAEWEPWPRDNRTYYAYETYLTPRYPLRKGFCRTCATERIGLEERVRFVEEEGLQRDFFAWLATDLRADDAQAVWRLLVRHDRELLEVRLGEFIGERCEDRLIEVLCG